MKLRLLSLSLCAMLIAGAFMTGCTNSTTPGTTTVGYFDTWRDVTTGLTDNTQYSFNITGGSSSNTKILGVSAWTSGTVRVFWTRAVGDSSQINVVTNSTASDAIKYAAADGNYSSSYRLWETSAPASVGPSGLILGSTPATASVTGSQSSKIDVVLATINSLPSPSISLQSADVQGSLVPSPARSTVFADAPYQVKGGLPMNALTGDISGSFTQGANSFDFPSYLNINDSSSAIISLKTADGNYARIEIVPQATKTFNGTTGHFLWADDAVSGKRYIDVKVTYQPTKGWGYVGRPGAVNHGFNTPRKPMGAPIQQTTFSN